MSAYNETWRDYYSQGIKYMKVAENSSGRPEIFTPVIVYNITAMAIEKMIMSVFLRSGNLPECHTLAGMALAAKTVMELDDALVNAMILMDRMQMICSEDDRNTGEPGSDDVPFFIDVMKRIFVKTEVCLKSGD